VYDLVALLLRSWHHKICSILSNTDFWSKVGAGAHLEIIAPGIVEGSKKVRVTQLTRLGPSCTAEPYLL
jgi:hypothetical protein